jgi:hypothetical protein
MKTAYKSMWKTTTTEGDPAKYYFRVFLQEDIPQIDIYRLILTSTNKDNEKVVRTFKGKQLLYNAMAFKITAFKSINSMIDEMMMLTIENKK